MWHIYSLHHDTTAIFPFNDCHFVSSRTISRTFCHTKEFVPLGHYIKNGVKFPFFIAQIVAHMFGIMKKYLKVSPRYK